MSVQSRLQANGWTRQPINVFLRLRVCDASRTSSQLSFTTRDLLDSLRDRVIVPEPLVASCIEHEWSELLIAVARFLVVSGNDQKPWGGTTLEFTTLENSDHTWWLLNSEGGKWACLCQAFTTAAQKQFYTSLPGLGTVCPV